jgi:hypothetical protein
VVFYAANYALRVPVAALAVAGEDRRRVRMWGRCSLCVAEYTATVAPTLSQHFVTESICLMTTYLVMIWLSREPEARGEVAESRTTPTKRAAPEGSVASARRPGQTTGRTEAAQRTEEPGIRIRTLISVPFSYFFQRRVLGQPGVEDLELGRGQRRRGRQEACARLARLGE